jgi:hypothetical protein
MTEANLAAPRVDGRVAIDQAWAKAFAARRFCREMQAIAWILHRAPALCL